MCLHGEALCRTSVHAVHCSAHHPSGVRNPPGSKNGAHVQLRRVDDDDDGLYMSHDENTIAVHRLALVW